MTWAQTITIVVPILVAVIAGIFSGNKQTDLVARMVGDLRTDMNARFATVDARLGGIDARLNGSDVRLDRFEEKIDARFEKVDARFDRLESKFERQLGELRLLLLDVLKPKTT